MGFALIQAVIHRGKYIGDVFSPCRRFHIRFWGLCLDLGSEAVKEDRMRRKCAFPNVD